MKFGCVSWLQAGTYYENAEFISKHVDFIELLVYTWNEEVCDLFLKELNQLRKLSIFYTVHLPTDSIQNCDRAYDFFSKQRFPINNFVLHPLDGWQDFINNRIDVTLENLIRSDAVYERMTLDIGHLMLSTKGESIFESGSIKNIREFHIHGIANKKDHDLLDDNTINYFRSLIRKYNVVRDCFEDKSVFINFEIFDYHKFIDSLERFKNAFV